ncbi:DMT family transporter [Litorisediminicola beolgyonensis]|uniref:DMT family transporter n=1 Tax=Litorisediminicola beolgyonensis TaxID=1173614 RepID=A0ABW3ZDS0_9RHOB
MSGNARGALLALLSFGLYALHDVIVKALGATYSPFQIVFFSVLFGFPLVTLLLIRDAEPGTLRPVHPWWTLTRTLAAVATAGSAFYAFSTLPLSQTYAILFASPLIITVLSVPILGETVRLRRWLAVAAGMIGVLVVLRPGATELQLGHLAALVASFGSALAAIIVRRIGQDERPVVLVLYPMLTNLVVMAAILPFVYIPMSAGDLGLTAAIAALAFAASMVVIAAYKAGEAVVVAPMQYSQILWATFYGALLFDELPSLTTLAGVAIIVTSGIYIVLREGGQSATSKTPVLESRSRLDDGLSPRVSTLLRLFRKQPPDAP